MSRLIATKGVKEYRATIPYLVNKNDTVLEIGFAWGTTCALLNKHANKVVGIDKGESYDHAVKTYPELELHKLDGFDIGKVIQLGYKFDVVYIDISGCRSLFDVIKIFQMYESAFEPRVIVVKSSRLKRLLGRSEVWGEDL